MAENHTRVLFVTGKGGTGKSSVATLLGRAGELRGLRTAVIDIGLGGYSRDGDRVKLNKRETLRDFLTHVLKLRYLSNRLMESRTFTAAATAAPGLNDLVTLSAITDLASANPLYGHDLVVVDAPSTGHSLALLAAPSRVLELVPLGPVASRADSARKLITDPRRTRAVVVTTPEELSVSEALTLHQGLKDLRVPLAPTVVNGVYPEVISDEQARWLETNSVAPDALLHRSRRLRQLSLIEKLESGVGPTVSVPMRFTEDAAGDDVCGALLSALTKGMGWP